jgi:hypothetical protein
MIRIRSMITAFILFSLLSITSSASIIEVNNFTSSEKPIFDFLSHLTADGRIIINR